MGAALAQRQSVRGVSNSNPGAISMTAKPSPAS